MDRVNSSERLQESPLLEWSMRGTTETTGFPEMLCSWRAVTVSFLCAQLVPTSASTHVPTTILYICFPLKRVILSLQCFCNQGRIGLHGIRIFQGRVILYLFNKVTWRLHSCIDDAIPFLMGWRIR